MEELYAWLSAAGGDRRARSGINRLCMLVRELQPELREAYPDLDHEHDAFGLIEWLHEHGVREGTLPAAVVPPTSRAASSRPSAGARASALNFGVNVAGYFTAELGIGEAARLLVARARRRRGAAAAACVPPTPPPSRTGHPYTALPTSAAAFPINLICVNADGLPRFREDVGVAFFDEPPQHRRVVVGGRRAAGRVARGVRAARRGLGRHRARRAARSRRCRRCPVHTVRFPIVAPRVAAARRARRSGSSDEWMFLSMFDHGSVLERKNPLGTIAAFAEAFAPDSGAVLVLKSINAEHDPRRARARCAPRRRRTRTSTCSRATSRRRRPTR